MRQTQIALPAGGHSIAEVDGDWPEPDNVDIWLRTAQHRLDSRDELVDVEWLGHVVVSAETQPQKLVGLLTPCREDDDGGFPPVSQHAPQLEPVEIGQHDIEQNEIGNE